LSSRRAVPLLLLALAIALTAAAVGPPSFTWANDGVRVEHPWAQAMAALGAALALGAAAAGARLRTLQLAAGATALALVGLAAHRFAWRIDAVEGGIHERSLAGGVSLRWGEVVAVEPGDGSVTLRGKDGSRLVIATSRFEPDERVRLERTIARRVREATREP
jgi:hypothetical protein